MNNETEKRDTDISGLACTVDEAAMAIIVGLSANQAFSSYEPHNLAVKAYALADALAAEAEFRAKGGSRKPIEPSAPAMASSAGRMHVGRIG